MPYEYPENMPTADVAFEAWGETLEELFTACAEAVVNLMVADLGAVASRRRLDIELKNRQLDMLLIKWLQEIIFYKDSQGLLLRPAGVSIRQDGDYTLKAHLAGEELNPDKHELLHDVKGATLHRLKLEQEQGIWRARVILDV